MKHKIIISTVAAVLTGVPATVQSAAQLRDGEYLCRLSLTMELGSIWIRGNRYIGPSRDPNGPAHLFEVTQSGTINWGAPMGGMDSGGNHVVGTVIKGAGGGKLGFDIQMKTETGHFHTASCDPQF